MKCRICAAEILPGDAFCLKCGAKVETAQPEAQANAAEQGNAQPSASKFRSRPAVREAQAAAQQAEIQREAVIITEENLAQEVKSLRESERREAGSRIGQGILAAFLILLIIGGTVFGVLAVSGFDVEAFLVQGSVSQSDAEPLPQMSSSDSSQENISTSATEGTSATAVDETSTTASASEKKTTTTTTTTTKATTTTTTTKVNVGKKIREASVGTWETDVSSFGINVAGVNINKLTIVIDKSGNCTIKYKVAFFTSSTTGSFTVDDNGGVVLLVKVPVTEETMRVSGQAELVSNDCIKLSHPNGEITMNRVK